eukprot:TRINITY_DN64580_c0_g1_i1.p3 TRINITY_DN64580_c0_g1~~TRINITY_DN64580_c0_g1_i1.p3  ORF type:complete len:140 (-),score=6.00 TRINITY_DN64580_c0_g1_i1:15-434(-)
MTYENSLLQRIVLTTIKDLGYDVQVEFEIPKTEIRVDILIKLESGKQIIVEVDGPLHYTINQPYQPIGKTVLRNRMLESLGYEVVVMPFFQVEARNWQQLKDYMGSQQPIIKNKKQALNSQRNKASDQLVEENHAIHKH